MFTFFFHFLSLNRNIFLPLMPPYKKLESHQVHLRPWVDTCINDERVYQRNGKDLYHPGVMRFATHFPSLQCLLMFKKELGKIFTCDKWVDSRYARTSWRKMVQSIILEDRKFWSTCQHIVKVSEPLVKVLRLVDGDEKPTMRYLYEAIENAKDTIKARLMIRLSQYLPYTRVIEQR